MVGQDTHFTHVKISDPHVGYCTPTARTSQTSLLLMSCCLGFPCLSLTLCLYIKCAYSLAAANSYVFPGGRLDKADSSPQWLTLFRHLSSNDDPFRPLLAARHLSQAPRLPIYSEVPEGPIVGEVACRICVVRELFEEAGVLLARERGQVSEVLDCLPGTFPPAVRSLGRGELSYWRERVHNDAEQFFNLCS